MKNEIKFNLFPYPSSEIKYAASNAAVRDFKFAVNMQINTWVGNCECGGVTELNVKAFEDISVKSWGTFCCSEFQQKIQSKIPFFDPNYPK